ncbi:MAG: hypothetical protein LBG23_03545 [Endomicrobium sp.]|nr:hypothetical protein [Endomicrobium sp.]
MKGFYIGGTTGMAAGSDNFKDRENALKEITPSLSIELSQPKFFYGLE